MRNLILLIKRYYTLCIFLVLEIICLSLVFSNNSYQKTSYVNSSRAISGSFFKQRQKLTDFFYLKKVNDSLASENARLKQKIGLTTVVSALRQDSTYTKTISSDTVTQTTHYKFIPCKVLDNTIDQKRNFITLNKGSNEGIKKGWVVISAVGVVGQVAYVSEHYSVVESILSEKSVISAMVPDGNIGKIYWNGKNPDVVTLKGLPLSVKLKPTDSIVTSPYSKYPEKVLIGQPVNKKSNKGPIFEIKLSTSFRNLHYVYVIEENTSIERIKIEEVIDSLSNE